MACKDGGSEIEDTSPPEDTADTADTGGGPGTAEDLMNPLPALDTLPGGNCFTETRNVVQFSERPARAQIAGIDGSAVPSGNVWAEKTQGECSPAISAAFPVSVNNLATDETWLKDYTSASCGSSAARDHCFLACGGVPGDSGGETCDAPFDEPSSCNGKYGVGLEPDVGILCVNYDDVRLEMPVTAASERKKTSGSTCTSGNGTFSLIPLNWHDNDHDGERHVAFLPVFKSGTGTPHRQSWVTRIDLPDDAGYTLRVVKTGQQLAYDNTDALISPTSSSFAVAEGTNTFTSGVIDGYPLFGVSELDSAHADAFEVDMWWTCGGPADTVARPAGYVIDLDAIGCGVDQKLVIRKHLSPDRVTIEPYGAPSETKSRSLVPVTGGERFYFGWGEMKTKVKITSTTPTHMQATIEVLKNNDVNICTAGTYTFPAL